MQYKIMFETKPRPAGACLMTRCASGRKVTFVLVGQSEWPAWFRRLFKKMAPGFRRALEDPTLDNRGVLFMIALHMYYMVNEDNRRHAKRVMRRLYRDRDPSILSDDDI